MDVPDNANSGCVGTQSDAAGKASACDGCPNQQLCASGAARQAAQAAQNDPALADIRDRMSRIGHTLLVLSGKGGVGKSTCAAQLAFSLARKGLRVGLLDIDICGPSIPLMLGLTGQEVKQSGSGWSPVYVTSEGSGGDASEAFELGVMSIGFMLPDSDAAVIWRGPRKNALIKQFLSDVNWGDLDYLVIDTPPGTSDEHISIAQYLRGSLDPKTDGAVVVTTPQEASMADVRKELNFCKKVGIRVLGVLENMSGMLLPLTGISGDEDAAMQLVDTATGEDRTAQMLDLIRQKCPELLKCSLSTSVLRPPAGGGPREMAAQFGAPYLGRLPLDPKVFDATERGRAVDPSSPSAGPLARIVELLIAAVGSGSA